VLLVLLFHKDQWDAIDLPLHWNPLSGIHHVAMWQMLPNFLPQQTKIPQVEMEMMGVMKLMRNSRI
jgi:hypothetical protein